MLEVEGLHAGYEGRAVVRGIDLRVGPGEIVALVGPNGAGKSTIAKAVAGMLPTLAGDVRLGGKSIAKDEPAARVRAGITLVPEGRQLFPTLTVRDNLVLGATARGEAGEEAIARVLDIFPALAARLAEPAGNLSGGQQQMVAIGRGLMAAPTIMVLDEPSLGLSPLLVRETFQSLRRLRGAGIGLLLVEQNARQSLAMADRAHVIENGRMLVSGSGADLLADPELGRRYLGRADGSNAGRLDTGRAGRLAAILGET